MSARIPVLCLLQFAFVAVAEDVDLFNWGVPCHVGGVVVDGVGNELDDVYLSVTIAETKKFEVTRRETNQLVNGRFELKYERVSGVSFEASKVGYIPSIIELNSRQLQAKDIVVKLMPSQLATRLVEVADAEMKAHYDGTGDGLKIASGEIVSTEGSPDIFLRLPPDWPPDSSIRPQKISICVASGGGIQAMIKQAEEYTAYSLASGGEAPADGYQSCVDVDFSNKAPHLFYFRTPSGLFGKMDMRMDEVLNKRQIWALGRYFYQPDGSRNLNNGERLKLIRAKRAK